MSSDPSGRRGREGFTLVEVLVAMVILAIGLLSLEAMAIGAARAVVRADLQSQYTSLATDRLEQTLVQIRMGGQPRSTSESVSGATVVTLVEQAAAGARQAFTVTVTVTPQANQRVNLTPVTVVGRDLR